MKASRLWMKISNDEYELPIAVADTAVELARICGVTADTIYSQMSRVRAGAREFCPYICIVI